MKRILPLGKLMVLAMLMLWASNTNAQLMSWQFGNPASAGNETSYAATYVDPHIASTALTRGGGLLASSFVRAFSSTDFTLNGTKTDAITNSDYLQVGLTVLAGSTVSIYNIDAHFRRSSTAAVSSYRWMYSINGGSFVEIGAADASYTGTTADGDDQTPIIVSGVAALQNLAAGTTVTLRAYFWGATTTTSTLAVGRYAASNTSPSLAIGGRVTPTGSTSLLGWQFGSPASAGNEATYSSTSNATGLATSILSRGAGIPGDPLYALVRGFTAGNFAPLNSVKTDAVNNGNYYQFTVTPSYGYTTSLSTIDARIRRTSAAANSYRWKYSVDGTNFTEIGAADATFMSTFDGTDQPQIDLSSITALQNITFGTTVTFRIYAWGNTTATGTFALGRYNVSGTTINSLELQGSMVALPSAATDYFRSKQTGNWQSTGIWESSSDNVNWMNSTLVPTNAATNISIVSGHTVTSSSDISIANTSVAGSLIVASNTSIAIPSSKTLTITGAVVLKSDATATASIAASQGSIVGDITVERYLNNKRAYRFIASALTTSTSIYANWQNGGVSTANIGTHITGDVAGTNGFDATGSGASSLFAFDNGTQLWKAFGISQTAPYNNTSSTVLKAGEAYRLFVRGDRSINLSSNTSSGQTTLLTKGSPVIGNYTFTTASSPVALNNTVNNWNLIGNPYLSEVDWKSASLTRAGLSTAFYLWDLSLNTRGAYAYFDASDNSFTGSATQYIQSGQAIFVQTTGAAPSLAFTEAAKSSGHNNITVFRNQNSLQQLSVQLSYTDAGQIIIADQANAVFNEQATKGKDKLDIEKFTNLDENIAFSIEGNNFIKDARPAMQGTDELQLAVWQLKKRSYTLVVSTSNVEANEMYVEDNYLHTSIPLNINATNSILFEVNDDAASSAKDRFKIVLKKNIITPQVVVSSFNATIINNVSNIEFKLLVSTKEASTVNIKVTNLLGQQLLVKTVNTNGGQETVSIPTNTLGNGLHIIEVSQGNERIVLKAIKQ